MTPPPRPVNDPTSPARTDDTQTTRVNSIMFKGSVPVNGEAGAFGCYATNLFCRCSRSQNAKFKGIASTSVASTTDDIFGPINLLRLPDVTGFYTPL